MKKIIIPMISLLLMILTYLYIEPITDYLANVISPNIDITSTESNEWTKNTSYLFASKTDYFIPYSYQDIINIFYSIIDDGIKQIIIYCPKEYTNCINDITNISSDNVILTHLNNYVHPFNSFNNVKTVISSAGEVTIKVNYLYTEKEIEKINTKVDEIINNTIKSSMNTYDKIKAIHDYIINNAKYDVERNDNGDSPYSSYNAYGPLFEGYAICNGYTDLMAIFLTKLNIDNYKIATTSEDLTNSDDGHIWNAVYYNNKWLHLDLTWDDPISKDGKDYLLHKYFLISNDELKKADSEKENIEEHNFDKKYYLEFN